MAAGTDLLPKRALFTSGRLIQWGSDRVGVCYHAIVFAKLVMALQLSSNRIHHDFFFFKCHDNAVGLWWYLSTYHVTILLVNFMDITGEICVNAFYCCSFSLFCSVGTTEGGHTTQEDTLSHSQWLKLFLHTDALAKSVQPPQSLSGALVRCSRALRGSKQSQDAWRAAAGLLFCHLSCLLHPTSPKTLQLGQAGGVFTGGEC